MTDNAAILAAIRERWSEDERVEVSHVLNLIEVTEQGGRLSSNHAANLEGIDNTSASRSQTTDSANPHTIPNSVAGCPHGCKKESDCLRYDQGGSIPADCALYATLNRTAEIATFDDEVCRASKGHCGRHGCCKGDPPYEEDATPNRAADQGADYVIARAIRERNPDYRMPELMAWDIVKRLREAGFDV